MNNQDTKPTPETKSPDPVETELNALKHICDHLNDLQSESRQRVFMYLKSRYEKDWPYTYD